MNKDQTWLVFQQMLLAQQQQQMMIQNQFTLYMRYCQLNGLNPNHPNSFNLFYQQFNYAPQPQPQPQQQPQTQLRPPPQQQQQTFYISNNLEELIPRSDQTIYINKEQATFPNKLNIALKATSGLNVIICADKNLPISQLFKQYMDRIGLSYKYLGNELQFLHNGARLYPFSNDPIYSIFKNNQVIVVYDQGSIVGAYDKL